METGVCENPFKIRNHCITRGKTKQCLVFELNSESCSENQHKYPTIRPGMKVCVHCYNKILFPPNFKPNCVDPLKRGPHNSSSYKIISLETQKLFHTQKSNLPIGSVICNLCRLRLLDNKQKLTNSTEVQNLSKKRDLCCNPFDLNPHSVELKCRQISETLVHRYSHAYNIEKGDKICSRCRSQLQREQPFQEMGGAQKRSRSRSPQHIHHSLELIGSLHCNKRPLDSEPNTDDPPIKVARHDDNHSNSSTLCSDFPSYVSTDSHTTRVSPKNYPNEFEMQTDTESSDCDSDMEYSPNEDDEIEDLSEGCLQKEFALQKINNCLEALSLSPASARSTDFAAKFREATLSLHHEITLVSRKTVPYSNPCCDCQRLIEDAKEKFRNADRQLRYLILTTLPRSIGQRATQRLFGCSRYLVKKAFEMRDKGGAFSSPVLDTSYRLRISNETRSLVENFYKLPEYSRSSPNQRDTLRIKLPGSDQYATEGKFRLLLTIPELYNEFLITYPNNTLSLSKFALLRPRQCIPIGHKMFHNTCTCIIHENFDLMLCALTENVDLKTILNIIPCDQKNEKCMIGLCHICPKEESMELLLSQLDTVDEIKFWQWEQSKGAEMVQITESVSTFKQRFRSQLPEVLKHHYLVRMQNQFLRDWRELPFLHQNEVLITVDFAMNFSFVYQDEIQSAHWGHRQATIHPFHVEYYNPNTDKLDYMDYIVISSDLRHNTSAFYAFQTTVVPEIKKDIPHGTRFRYVSDGCGAQYKNCRNIKNIVLHARDFGIPGIWDYTPTAHGKSACDRLSATAKQTVRRECLKRKKGAPQITNAYEMYSFLQNKAREDKVERRKYFYVSQLEVDNIFERKLKQRFQGTKTFKGTRGFHSILPISSTQFEARLYTDQESHITLSIDESETIDINEHDCVAVNMNNEVEYGRVTDTQNDDIVVEFYKKIMTSGRISLSWPDFRAQHSVALENIICKICQPRPTTKSRRIFTISEADSALISSKLNA